ncbi:hypothetical protein E2C01_061468 [Portunus trituberculatus]|uniref:Uncharacterized protein n=1 Tax=Portunus trituberculatus TaxID=210409 RepID=A0A5B7HCH4_PORTR|nr:hypothetical protein [Portunus trituberculatus]
MTSWKSPFRRESREALSHTAIRPFRPVALGCLCSAPTPIRACPAANEVRDGQVLMAAQLQFYSRVTHQFDRSLHSSAASPVWRRRIRVGARHLQHKALGNSRAF